jgi:phenylpyruvate tautomerase PptA (4-oxalocrotonate tautomerase family)
MNTPISEADIVERMVVLIAETLGCKTSSVSVAIKEVDEDDC